MLLKKPDILQDPKGLSRSGLLTPELLKSFDGCQNLSNDQAEEIVIGLQSLAGILFELYTSQNSSNPNRTEITHHGK